MPDYSTQHRHSKNRILTFVATISLAPLTSLNADVTEQDPKLPAQSRHLVSRLKEFEIREQKKVDYLINKKRAEVLTILQRHLKQYVKSGQLDQAVAIKKAIASIKADLPQEAPLSLTPLRQKFELKGEILRASRVPSYFEIDIDESKGRIFLDFEHPRLKHAIDQSEKITLNLTISSIKYAGSADSVIVKLDKVIIGEHKKPEPGEKIAIVLDKKSLTTQGKKLTLVIENSGKDRIGFQTNTKPFASLTMKD